MFITRKRFEKELEKAREEGYCKAMEQRNMDDSFRCIHERIDRLENMIDKPKAVPGFSGEVKPNA